MRQEPAGGGTRIRAVLFYDPHQLFTPAVRDHVSALRLYSGLDILFSPLTRETVFDYDFDFFDAVMIHYSIRPVFGGLPDGFAERLAGCRAAKVLFCQDEYDFAGKLRKFMKEAEIDLVFSVVPDDEIAKVYPADELPSVRIVSMLTGYVPLGTRPDRDGWTPLEERPLIIAYRGRQLPFFYGRHAQKKFEIGRRMAEICESRGIPADIAWDEHSRIYHDAWPEFVRSSRATLITESGANLFDQYGEVRKAVSAFMAANPEASYDAVASACGLDELEGRITMNQISPRAFEAIAEGTILIGFRGDYSGILKAGVHYLPLEEDFSNIDEVLSQLDDIPFLEQMRCRAFDDIIAAQRWTYRNMGGVVGREISATLGMAPPAVRDAPDWEEEGREARHVLPIVPQLHRFSALTSLPRAPKDHHREDGHAAMLASGLARRLFRALVDATPKRLVHFAARLVPAALRHRLRQFYLP